MNRIGPLRRCEPPVHSVLQLWITAAPQLSPGSPQRLVSPDFPRSNPIFLVQKRSGHACRLLLGSLSEVEREAFDQIGVMS